MTAAAIRGWIEAGLAFLYPPICQLCNGRRAGPDEGYVCARCQSQAHFITPPFCERCGLPYPGEITAPFECANCREIVLHFTSARSAVIANGVVLEAIHRYKYRRALWFEPFLAGLLLRAAVPALLEDAPDAIVPVPLHPVREREREFNQAERMASRLGAAARIPVNRACLRRVAPTRTQTLLTRQERAANMRNAFALREGARLDDQRIVLVDDVFTTGATTNACAKALLGGGAREVCVWTVARGT